MLVRRVREYVGCRAGLLHAPQAHHDKLITQESGLVAIMGNEQYGDVDGLQLCTQLRAQFFA